MTRTGIPTLYVVGTASREITPDRVTVTLEIGSALHAESPAALADAAARRSRVTEAMRAALPGMTIADRRVSVEEVTRAVERETAQGKKETYYERRGFTGHCQVILRAGAERAAEVVAHAGAHPDVSELRPSFTVSAALARATQRDLEADAVRDGLDRAGALAEAAGGRVLEVVSIGEWLQGEGRDSGGVGWNARYAMSDSVRVEPGDVLDDLGELVPEPVYRSARVPVRVALAFD